MATLNSSPSSAKKLRVKGKAGFTLIELAVTLTMLAIFAGIVMTYGRTASRSLESANLAAGLIGVMNHAKSLSQTYNTTDVPDGKQACSYGIYVYDDAGPADLDYVQLFQDLVDDTADCETDRNNQYDPSASPSEALETSGDIYYLSKGFRFVPAGDPNAPDLVNAVFIPPDSKAILNNNTAIPAVVLKAQDENNSDLNFSIRINSFGQITLE